MPTFVRSRGGWGSVIVWCQIIVSASSVHKSTLTWRFTVSVIKVLMEDLLLCFLPARLMTRQAVLSQRLPLSMPVTASAYCPRLGSLHLDRVTLFACTAVCPRLALPQPSPSHPHPSLFVASMLRIPAHAFCGHRLFSNCPFTIVYSSVHVRSP